MPPPRRATRRIRRALALALAATCLSGEPASGADSADKEGDAAAALAAARYRQRDTVVAALPPPSTLPDPTAGATAARRGPAGAAAAAIRAAAAASGADPDLLLAIAAAESGLRPAARNPRSSAAGPMQFTATTWLAALARFGPCFSGAPSAAAEAMASTASRAAEAVQARPPARRTTTRAHAGARDAAAASWRREADAARRAALALRHDPRAAALIAGALVEEDARRFAAIARRRPADAGEAYAVHFLGVGTAAALVRAAHARPVSQILPHGVLRANREVFLDRRGRPVSAGAARQWIAGRLAAAAAMLDGVGGPPVAAAVELAEAPPGRTAAALASEAMAARPDAAPPQE